MLNDLPFSSAGLPKPHWWGPSIPCLCPHPLPGPTTQTLSHSQGLTLIAAWPVGSPLSSYLGLGQSFQLMGQLLHVGVHHGLLDLQAGWRPRGNEPQLPAPGSPPFQKYCTSDILLGHIRHSGYHIYQTFSLRIQEKREVPSGVTQEATSHHHSPQQWVQDHEQYHDLGVGRYSLPSIRIGWGTRTGLGHIVWGHSPGTCGGVKGRQGQGKVRHTPSSSADLCSAVVWPGGPMLTWMRKSGYWRSPSPLLCRACRSRWPAGLSRPTFSRSTFRFCNTCFRLAVY